MPRPLMLLLALGHAFGEERTVKEGNKTFRLTEHNYTDSHHATACETEFGNTYRAADWELDLLNLSASEVESMSDDLRIRVSFNKLNFFVTSGGKLFWEQGSTGRTSARAYFFERHEGKPPGNWLVHDQHGGLSLGSWFGVRGPVLCVEALALAPSPAGSADAFVGDNFSFAKPPGHSRRRGAGGEAAPREAPDGGRDQAALQGAKTFRLTKYTYTDSHFTGACHHEFGKAYRVADWKFDILRLNASAVNDTCNNVGIRPSIHEIYFFVTAEGTQFWEQGSASRAYFFERRDGKPPRNWLVHDRHAGLILGSWFGVAGRVLCAKAPALPSRPARSATAFRGDAFALAEPTDDSRELLPQGLLPPPARHAGRVANEPSNSSKQPGKLEVARLEGKTFRLTEHNYTDTHHATACTDEFGKAYRVADWKFDLLGLHASSVEDMCKDLDIRPSFNELNFFVTAAGSHFWEQSSISRAYFFERHDGKPPPNWLVHDQHGGLTLGSWFGIRGPVLCVRAPALPSAPAVGHVGEVVHKLPDSSNKFPVGKWESCADAGKKPGQSGRCAPGLQCAMLGSRATVCAPTHPRRVHVDQALAAQLTEFGMKMLDGVVSAFLGRDALAPSETNCLAVSLGNLGLRAWHLGHSSALLFQEALGEGSAAGGGDGRTGVLGFARLVEKLQGLLQLIGAFLEQCVGGGALAALRAASRHLGSASYMGGQLMSNGVNILEDLAEAMRQFENLDAYGFGRSVGRVARQVLLARGPSAQLPEGPPPPQAMVNITAGLLQAFFARGFELEVTSSVKVAPVSTKALLAWGRGGPVPRGPASGEAAEPLDIHVDLHKCVEANGGRLRVALLEVALYFAKHEFPQIDPSGPLPGPLRLLPFFEVLSQLPEAASSCGLSGRQEQMLVDAAQALDHVQIRLKLPHTDAGGLSAIAAADRLERAAGDWRRGKWHEFGTELGRILLGMLVAASSKRYEVESMGGLQRLLGLASARAGAGVSAAPAAALLVPALLLAAPLAVAARALRRRGLAAARAPEEGPKGALLEAEGPQDLEGLLALDSVE